MDAGWVNMTRLNEILEAQSRWLSVEADDENFLSDLAHESLEKCAKAVSILMDNMRGIGYPWGTVERIPAAVLQRNIPIIEKTMEASVPRILILFWEKVGGVSLVDLEEYRHVGFWKELELAPPAGFCDGLHVDACSQEWTDFVCSDFVDWRDIYRTDEDKGFLLSLSPDGFHKDNISGGAPYGMHEGSSWKPVWENFEWTGIQRPVSAPDSQPDFLSYLRTTLLECAGFPGLYGMPGFEPIRERLLRGLPVF
jgi:hypothetical protein